MEIKTTEFEGLLVLQNRPLTDDRGLFLKLFNYDFFRNSKLDADFKEFYYSTSNKNVIRGMHFQVPPYHHAKLVYVSHGRILDVVIDLRRSSATYKKHFTIELNGINGKYLYIPVGFAHGFLSLENETIVNYAQTSCYSKEHDSGILFNSFEFEWEIDNPIISDRDLSFVELNNFESPF
jgi:dTDP-4-dehydrorhamnose 3,5-epimerase